MSLTTAAAHPPRSEPSPPTSPVHSQRDIQIQPKQVAAKRLPVSPPVSASPSPAHISSQMSSHTSTSTTQPIAPGLPSTMSSSHLNPPRPEVDFGKPDTSNTLPRTSSKHRLDDAEETAHEPHKRRRTDHDRDGSQKTEDVAERTVAESTVAESTSEPAPLYRLSDQPVPRSRPHPTQHLFHLYGLDPLADTVRRKDPNTGEKINKLRKSYESKIKEFPGKNKPVQNEGEFFYLLNYPDEEWGISHQNDKEISQALSADGKHLSDQMGRKVDVALSGMSSGPLPQPEKDKWRSVLDLESSAPKAKTVESQPSPARQQPSHITTQTSIEGVRRPKRRGTKRNYNDEAFEGYNEGFVDDEIDLSGDGDDDRRSSLSAGGSRKRRRKDSGPVSTFPGTAPQWAVSVGGKGR